MERKAVEAAKEAIIEAGAKALYRSFVEGFAKLALQPPHQVFLESIFDSMEKLELKADLNFSPLQSTDKLTLVYFDGARVAAHITAAARSRPHPRSVDNPNLKAAVVSLNAMLNILEDYIQERCKERAPDNALTLVLLTLHASLQSLYKELADIGKEDVLSVSRINQISQAINDLSAGCARFTEAAPSESFRRGFIAGELAKCAAVCQSNLKRFADTPSLKRSMRALKGIAMGVSEACHQTLLSLVVVDPKEAATLQTSGRDQVELMTREHKLRGIATVGVMETRQELVTRKVESTGVGERKSTVAANPFFNQVQKVLAGEEKYFADLEKYNAALKEKEINRSGYAEYKRLAQELDDPKNDKRFYAGYVATGAYVKQKKRTPEGERQWEKMRSFYNQYEAYQRADRVPPPAHPSGTHERQFVFLTSLFKLIDKLPQQDSKAIAEDVKEFEAQYRLCASGQPFVVVAGLLHRSVEGKAESPEVQRDKEMQFIKTLFSLMQQSYQLEMLMTSILRFVELVGKIGMSNAIELHQSLSQIIEHAEAKITESITALGGMTRRDVSVGSWFFLIKRQLTAIQEGGKNLKVEAIAVAQSFEKLQDRAEIDKEFDQARGSLLQAAHALGVSTGFAELSRLEAAIGRATPTVAEVGRSLETSAHEEFAAHAAHMTERIEAEKIRANQAAAEAKAREEKLEKDLEDQANKEKKATAEAKALEAKVTDLTRNLEQKSRDLSVQAADITRDMKAHHESVSNFISKIATSLVKAQTDMKESVKEIQTLSFNTEEKKVVEGVDIPGERKLLSDREKLTKASALEARLVAQVQSLNDLLGVIRDYQAEHKLTSDALTTQLGEIQATSAEIGIQLTLLKETIGQLQRRIQQLEVKEREQALEIERLRVEKSAAEEKAVARQAEALRVQKEEWEAKIRELTAQTKSATPAPLAPVLAVVLSPEKRHKEFLAEVASMIDLEKRKGGYIDKVKNWLLSEKPDLKEREAFAKYILQNKSTHLLAVEQGRARRLFSAETSDQTKSIHIVLGMLCYDFSLHQVATLPFKPDRHKKEFKSSQDEIKESMQRKYSR